MLEAIEYYHKFQTTLDAEKQIEHFARVLEIAAENLWTIGTIMPLGQLRAVSARIRNCPTTNLGWWRGDRGRYDTWYFEE